MLVFRGGVKMALFTTFPPWRLLFRPFPTADARRRTSDGHAHLYVLLSIHLAAELSPDLQLLLQLVCTGCR